MNDDDDDDEVTIIHSPQVAAEGGGVGECRPMDECEKADMVVCNYADFSSPFRDNVFTLCHYCGDPIQHRPHAPKRPPKVCMFCASLASLPEGHA